LQAASEIVGGNEASSVLVDQAEEAQRGVTDEAPARRRLKKPKP